MKNRPIRFRAWIESSQRMIQWDEIIGGWYSNILNMPRAMQFTGLLDMHGKEIFESDILRWKNWEQEPEIEPDMYIVSYKAPSFIWDCYKGDKKLETNGEILIDTHEFEVIGNVFENRELLASTV